jgi:hypothetical protein
MTFRPLFSFLLGMGFVVAAGSVGAQDGRIFSGGFFDTLYAAIDMEYLPLKHSELRFQILNRSLTAVVIPEQQPTGGMNVLTGNRASTELKKVSLTKEDFGVIRDFAQDGVFLAMAEVRSSPNDKKKLQTLQQTVNKLPAQQKEVAKLFVGARMADMELPKDHELNSYVQGYRSHVEKNAKNALSKPDVAAKYQDHVPYSFGTPDVSHSQLKSIRPEDIETVTVNGKQYKKAWVRGTLIIVPQSQTSPPPPKNATGLDKLSVAPHVVNHVTKEGGNRPVPSHHQR